MREGSLSDSQNKTKAMLRTVQLVRGTKLLLVLGKCLLQTESNHNLIDLINKSIDVART